MQLRKKIAQALAAAGFVIVLTAGTAFASYGTGTVTADALRMRSQPNTTSSVLTMVYKGSKVEVLSGAENGWYKVRYNGYEGYMSADWLNVVVTASSGSTSSGNTTADTPTSSAPAESSATQTPPEEPVTSIVGSTGTVTGAGLLNVRSGPNVECARIGVLQDGNKVTILEVLEGWYKVSAGNGMVGYVSSKYISFNSDYQATTKEGMIINGPLNVRTGPGTGYDLITTFKTGTTVSIIASSNGWYRVSANGVTGYVHGGYVVVLDNVGSSPVGAKAAALAKSLVGCRYVYGAEGPNTFDCSGLAYYIYGQLGYSIARGSSSQYKNSGYFVSMSEMEPGDLIYFFDPKYDGSGGTLPTTHMGIYVGNGQFIHASTSSYKVEYDSVYGSYYTKYIVGVKRIV